MAEQRLADFGKSFDMSRVKAFGGARAGLTTAGPDGAALRVTAPSSTQASQAAGIELTPPGGRWDLSPYTHVVVEWRNAGPQSLVVHCRVENPDSDGALLNCAFDKDVLLPGASGLAPGESGRAWVELSRKKPPWVKVDLCGVIGRPWSDSPTDQRPEGAIDPEQAVKIVVYLLPQGAEQSLEITAIRAVGDFLPPTPLLKDPARFFPFIDEFGQYMHADWPGKTRSAADLAKARQAESADLSAHGEIADWDPYGGWAAGPALEATGWFRVARHEGKWWLVDPEGRLFLSHGVDCVNWTEGNTPIEEREKYFQLLPPLEGEFADCYQRLSHPALIGYYQGKQPMCFAFGQANLMRKYGPAWRDAYAEVSHRRLRSWGLNTIGNWSEPAIYTRSRTPYTVNVRFGGKLLEGSQGYWGKFRDVFDPDFRSEVRRSVAEQTRVSSRDPWCLGYFVDNEISWGTDDVSLAIAALASPATQTAKKAFVGDLRAKYGTINNLNAAWGADYESWEALLASQTPGVLGRAPDANRPEGGNASNDANGQGDPNRAEGGRRQLDAVRAHDDLAAFHAKTAETYFQVVREAMEEYAAHQLYLGCRFAWYNAPAVAAAARYCDVVSFNIYNRSVANFRLPVDADVPLMIGEFHFGALDRGMFHPGLVPVEDQAARAEAYREYVEGLVRHPQFVGCHWFKYMDEPTTGRPFDQENYQVGLVDIADTPYVETIEAVRQMGTTMYQTRMGR